MKTIHLVSHTHWDREWYLTFQQFRVRLVRVVDRLLVLFEKDPDYRHFMLDGQAVVLEDYLQVRPEKTELIKSLVQSGRLVIGPWYVLADEFLVSPESLIRNLMEGQRICNDFGAGMPVGYVPDSFGQIGQLPQILNGFGIESACFWRGLADENCELWWQSPDGSRVLVSYLREGYNNGASLPTDQPAAFTTEIKSRAQLLEKACASQQILMMHGTDHAEPMPGTSTCVDYANNNQSAYQIKHSTLPLYIQQVMEDLGEEPRLPVVYGQLRASKRSPVLPGVLSTRMWIKQRNHQCENLLERWVEPYSIWARYASPQDPLTTSYMRDHQQLIRQAWRLLMLNHPHDSICGTSIDQVHEEMRSRFDQAEQMGEEIALQSLNMLASIANTCFPLSDETSSLPDAIVVYNPTGSLRSDRVLVDLDMPASIGNIRVVDEDGNIIPHQFTGSAPQELLLTTLSRNDINSALSMIKDGRILGLVVKDLKLTLEDNCVNVEAVMSDAGDPDFELLNNARKKLDTFMANQLITTFKIHAVSSASGALLFVAPDVPGCGYRTFWVQPCPPANIPAASLSQIDILLQQGRLWFDQFIEQNERNCFIRRTLAQIDKQQQTYQIENEFFTLTANMSDGSISLTDKRSNMLYSGLNRFVDNGDCGDTYNTCPPLLDKVYYAESCSIKRFSGVVEQSLEINLTLKIPAGLSVDRKSRSTRMVTLPITTRVSLCSGIPRVDIHTTVENITTDHRLRVQFPVPFTTTQAHHGSAFEVVQQAVGAQRFNHTWIEQPRPERPQRMFSTLTSRGLPEIEACQRPDCQGELSLTLLRCVGWLSRDDFSARKGHAGPGKATPLAQMLGTYQFDYSIIPHAGGWQNGFTQAESFDVPLRAIQSTQHKGRVSSSASMLDVAGQFSLTCIKAANDGSGVIVRGYRWGHSGKIALRCNLPLDTCHQVRLDEQIIQPLEAGADGYYHLQARPFEIITLKFS
ncbi:MAG: hypothetical protein LWX83_00560 [Anaerolineae bacterium]|nr:hypothetical protein [Anaerolineae bacterium]